MPIACRRLSASAWVSRQRLSGRRGSGVRGGKGEKPPTDRLDQQAAQQVGVEEGAAEGLVLGDEGIQLEERFVALEDEFNLPAEAIERQHPLGGEVGGGHGREDEEVVGRFEGLKAGGLALLAGLGLEAAAGLGGGLGVPAQRHYPTRDRRDPLRGHRHGLDRKLAPSRSKGWPAGVCSGRFCQFSRTSTAPPAALTAWMPRRWASPRSPSARSPG